MKYSDLTLCIHDKNKPPVGCGYYYTVQSKSLSHTAFRTKKALKTWLKLTGLKIGERLHNRCVKLDGEYISNMEMLDNKEFFEKHKGEQPYYALCNGDYSIGFKKDNILSYQNPNTNRIILDYKKARTHLETGKKPSLIF